MRTIFLIRHTHAISDRNTFEKLLVILEFTHFTKNRNKKKEVINEFVVSVAVNIAGLNISINEE